MMTSTPELKSPTYLDESPESQAMGDARRLQNWWPIGIYRPKDLADVAETAGFQQDRVTVWLRSRWMQMAQDRFV